MDGSGHQAGTSGRDVWQGCLPLRNAVALAERTQRKIHVTQDYRSFPISVFFETAFETVLDLCMMFHQCATDCLSLCRPFVGLFVGLSK